MIRHTPFSDSLVSLVMGLQPLLLIFSGGIWVTTILGSIATVLTIVWTTCQLSNDFRKKKAERLAATREEEAKRLTATREEHDSRTLKLLKSLPSGFCLDLPSIASHLGLSKEQASEVLCRLDERGMVQRVGNDQWRSR